MRKIEDILRVNRYPSSFVTPDSSLEDAVMQMADQKTGAIPVLNGGKMVGILTNKDCINALIVNGKSPEETKVREIMAPDQTGENCLNVMTQEHAFHLPVIAESSFVGLVSMSDVLKTIVDEQKDIIRNLENYILGVGYAK